MATPTVLLTMIKVMVVMLIAADAALTITAMRSLLVERSIDREVSRRQGRMGPELQHEAARQSLRLRITARALMLVTISLVLSSLCLVLLQRGLER